LKPYDLPSVRPELVGIRPEWVEDFLNEAEKRRIRLHGFTLLRDGQVAAEVYWKPFHHDYIHRLYSSTKSLVSTAIGLACDRGLLSLDDPIIRFFPDLVDTKTIHPYVAEATVRDLLRMMSPFSRATYDDPDIKGKEWLASYFRTKPDHPSGTLYHYDSCGSYVLGAIVKRVTGKDFFEYLRENIFGELGFSADARCLEGPDGELWAGSAAILRLCDFAKLSQLYLNRGRWNGKQLLSEEYVLAATARQVDNNTANENSPWLCGYGYQFWILPENAFAMVGMGSQLAICVPSKNLVFACNADTQGSHGGHETIYETLWQTIVSRLTPDDAPLPLQNEAYARLCAKTEHLTLTPVAGASETAVSARINHCRYRLNDNPMQISELTVHLNENGGVLVWRNPRGEKRLPFHFGEYIPTTFPETHFNGERLGVPANREFEALACGAWVSEHTLSIHCCIIDIYFGNITIALSFKNNQIAVSMHKTAQFFLKEYQGFAGGIAVSDEV